MKTALLALFFLLFVFYTEVTADKKCDVNGYPVRDVNGNPVRCGQSYHIRAAANPSQAISLDQIENKTCPISVVLGPDAKQVIFHNQGDGDVKTEELLSIEFYQVPPCVEPPRWKVQADNNLYPIVIGPPENAADNFKFLIRNAPDQCDAYNLFFRYQALATKYYRDEESLLVLIEPRSPEALTVKFYPAESCYSNPARNSFI